MGSLRVCSRIKTLARSASSTAAPGPGPARDPVAGGLPPPPRARAVERSHFGRRPQSVDGQFHTRSGEDKHFSVRRDGWGQAAVGQLGEGRVGGHIWCKQGRGEDHLACSGGAESGTGRESDTIPGYTLLFFSLLRPLERTQAPETLTALAMRASTASSAWRLASHGLACSAAGAAEGVAASGSRIVASLRSFSAAASPSPPASSAGGAAAAAVDSLRQRLADGEFLNRERGEAESETTMDARALGVASPFSHYSSLLLPS